MTEREAFEAFAATHELSLRTVDSMGGPQYSDCNTDYAWLAWQASRKQALEEVSSLCQKLGDHEQDMGRDREANGCDICWQAIESLTTPTGEKA